jgi:hypothetical protein
MGPTSRIVACLPAGQIAIHAGTALGRVSAFGIFVDSEDVRMYGLAARYARNGRDPDGTTTTFEDIIHAAPGLASTTLF